MQDWPQLLINQPLCPSSLQWLSKWDAAYQLVAGQTQLLEMWCCSKAAGPSDVAVIEQLWMRCRTFPGEQITIWEELMAHIVLWLINCQQILIPRDHSWWRLVLLFETKWGCIVFFMPTCLFPPVLWVDGHLFLFVRESHRVLNLLCMS